MTKTVHLFSKGCLEEKTLVLCFFFCIWKAININDIEKEIHKPTIETNGVLERVKEFVYSIESVPRFNGFAVFKVVFLVNLLNHVSWNCRLMSLRRILR